MNAEKFFKEHSLEEISKKTKISPISLRLIRNKEFEKIPKVKLLGFIKIIEKTYNIDLSDLINEYNNHINPKPLPKKNTPKITYSEKNSNSTFFITFLAVVLIIIGGFLIFQNTNTPKKPVIEKNISLLTVNPKNNKSDKNISNKKKTVFPAENITKETNTSKMPVLKKFMVIIIPHKKIWFKAVNIDTNKSVQYLTAHTKKLPKGNYYIKFGHGEFNLTYNNQTIFPNTKKIVRILLKNGNYKFMKKPNRFEK